MFGAIGDAIDTANKVLGNTPAPAGAAASTAEFVRGEPLGENTGAAGNSVAPNNSGTKANLFNTTRQTEFIHFGHVHVDRADKFPHPQFDPAALKPPEGHAIQFRDALEREAILLNGFISNTKKAIDESQNTEGAIGEALGAVSSLTGGGGASAPSTGPLDAALKLATAAGGAIVSSTITYPPIHKAGVDLHQARANYHAFVKTQGDKPASSGGGAGSLIPIPAIGGATDFIQKILFKPMDVSTAMFVKPLLDYERPIIDACYRMTGKAIREQQCPTFPVWFPIPEGPQAPPPPQNSNDPGFVKDIKNDVKEASDTAASYKKKLQDFLGIEDDQLAPGDEFFDAAFSGIAQVDRQVNALKAGIGVESLPGPIVSVISEIAQSCAEILKVAYKKILKQSAAQPVDKEFLLAAADEFLAHKMITLVISLVPFLDPSNSVNVGGLGAVGANTVDKKVEELVGGKLAPELDFILQFAVGQLGDQLNAVQKAAAAQQSLTMECFFGVLPRVYCLFVRNTFFPIFDLIIDKVFGLGNNPIAQGLSPIKSMLKTGKDIAGTAQDVKNRVDNAANMLGSGVNQNNAGQFVNAITNGTPAAAAPGAAAGGAAFPGSARQPTGVAVKIPKADLDSVEPENKYEAALPAA